jgi:hypothetical protein
MNDIDTIRANALRQIDQAQRVFKLAIFGMAFFEAVCLLGFVLNANFKDKLHLLLFFGVGVVYMPLCMGLLALGAYVNRCTLRVLARLDDLAP